MKYPFIEYKTDDAYSQGQYYNLSINKLYIENRTNIIAQNVSLSKFKIHGSFPAEIKVRM